MAKRKPRVEQAEIVRQFGIRLRETRISVGMTQAELATKSGVTSVHVWRLEAGGSAPGIDLVERLAKTLGVSMSNLLPEGPSVEDVSIFRDQAKMMFDVITKSGNRDTFSVLNPLLACLVESIKRKS
jgi:transcriptional regulator with XRE-family HTH domain